MSDANDLDIFNISITVYPLDDYFNNKAGFLHWLSKFDYNLHFYEDLLLKPVQLVLFDSTFYA